MTAHLIPSLGWGAGSGSRNLYQVHLELVEQSLCKRIYNFGGVTHFDQDLQICSGDFQNGGRSTCFVGDNCICMNVKNY